MPLINIEHGSLASSEVMNDNFEYLDNRITTVAGNLTSATSSINSSIASMNSTFTQQNESIMSDISDLAEYAQAIRNDFDSQNNAPDYTHPVSLTFSQGKTIDYNGWLYIAIILSGTNLKRHVKINGSDVCYAKSGSDGGSFGNGCTMTRVSVGDVINITDNSGSNTTSGTTVTLIKYKFKGGQ